MKNNLLQELLISGILIMLLVLFLNPFDFWMLTALLMMMVLGLVVVFSLFASFVWRENHRDEREGLHKMMAGRVAFLVGTALLALGIIIQSFNQNLDPWLVFTLAGMIVAKVFTLIYGRIKN
jgi:cell division protein FtsW (lipid II flippase)